MSKGGHVGKKAKIEPGSEGLPTRADAIFGRHKAKTFAVKKARRPWEIFSAASGKANASART